MARYHFTLRITPTTDVAQSVARLDTELVRAGVDNSALTALVAEIGLRFQRELLSLAGSQSTSANTLLRGLSYRIRVTTQQPSIFEALCERLLPRRVTLS